MEDPRLVAANAIALAVTLIVLFTLRPRALRLGLVDRPSARKRHRGAVPLIGGLSFFIGTVAALLYLREPDPFLMALIPAAALICIVGVIDDLKDLSVKSRLLVQGAAVVVVMGATGVYIDNIGPLFGSQSIHLGLFGLPLTAVAVVAMINAFNMLDGIDGLAGSISMLTIALIMAFVGPGWETVGVMLLLQVMFTALVPYLLVNMGWPDGRKVFMGDAGSTVIGFMLAWSMIYLSQRGVGHFRPIDMLWCAALPIMETPAVMFRRMRLGLSPFKPDRRHIHHMLLDGGLSPRRTLAVIVASAALLAMVGYLLRDTAPVISLLVFCGLAGIYLWGTQESLQWLARLIPAGGGRGAAPRSLAAEDTSGAHVGDLARMSDPDDGRLRVLCVVQTLADAVSLAPLVARFRGDGRFEVVACVLMADSRRPERLLQLFGGNGDLVRVLDLAGDTGTSQPGMLRMPIQNLLDETRPGLVLICADTPLCDLITSTAQAAHIAVSQLVADSGLQVEVGQVGHSPVRTIATMRLLPAQAGSTKSLAPPYTVASAEMATSILDFALERIADNAGMRTDLHAQFPFIEAARCVLVTDVVADQRGAVFAGISDAALRWPEVSFVWIGDLPGASGVPGNVHFVSPRDYLDYAALLGAADLVVTDSSDIQRDATHLGCASISPAALRGQAIERGQVDVRVLVAENVVALLGNPSLREAMSRAQKIVMSDGDHCVQIMDMLATLPRASLGQQRRFTNSSPLTRAA